jgi:hypothetical protein
MKHLLKQFTAPALLLATILYQPSTTHAQSTAFSYQGRLDDGGSPAGGIYDLRFALFNAVTAGTQQGGLLTNAPTAVSKGLFTVTLDFGNQFPGANRWLEIAVRTNGGGAFSTLAPRQAITATPYAITAGNVTGPLLAGQLTSGTVPDARLSANVSLLGTAIESAEITDGTIAAADVNAVSFNTTFWRTAGNAGTTPGTHFIGTTDNQPLELKVNGLRALRIENNGDSTDGGTTPDGAPNLIAGSPRNFVGAGVVGATIAGGGVTNYGGIPYTNWVLADFGVVGGGFANTIAAGSLAATIAGGRANDISTNSDYSTIGGGYENNIATNSFFATIPGGVGNNIGANSSNSTIGGGEVNIIAADSFDATIAGGLANDIGANSDYSVIGGGQDNDIAADSFHSIITGGAFNDIGTNSDYCAIGGGADNDIASDSASTTIAGGYDNDIGTNSNSSAIGGGYDNDIASGSSHATISGGVANDIGTVSFGSTIGGGAVNRIYSNSEYATIPGGNANNATNYAFAAGHQAQAIHTGAFVWSDGAGTLTTSTTNNSVTMRARGGFRFITDDGTAGAQLLAGDTSWSVLSDRNMKKDFAAVDHHAILEKLAALPITRWNYQWEKGGTPPHLGPMAQDFKAAFYPGADDKSISTLEFDGVTLAAIQGLNEKVEDRGRKSDDRIQKLEMENAELQQRLEKLEQLLNHKLNGAVK